MRYKYITKIEIKFDKKKTFKRKSIKYLQNYIFQESVKLPAQCLMLSKPKHPHGLRAKVVIIFHISISFSANLRLLFKNAK